MSENQTERIFGKNAVLECLNSELSVNKIWMSNHSHPRLKEIEEKARSKKIPVIKLDKKDLDRMANGAEHRSVIAEIAPITIHDESFLNQEKIQKILIPVNIEDPHNLGAIIRTAYAFNVDAIVITKHKGSPVNETVISTSAGAALRLPIVRITNVVTCIEKLKKNGFWVYGSNVSKDKSQDLYTLDFDKKSVILMGNEGSGLSDNILKHCDFQVHIPIAFESLNVSVATGIILSRVYSTANKLT